MWWDVSDSIFVFVYATLFNATTWCTTSEVLDVVVVFIPFVEAVDASKITTKRKGQNKADAMQARNQTRTFFGRADCHMVSSSSHKLFFQSAFAARGWLHTVFPAKSLGSLFCDAFDCSGQKHFRSCCHVLIHSGALQLRTIVFPRVPCCRNQMHTKRRQKTDGRKSPPEKTAPAYLEQFLGLLLRKRLILGMTSGRVTTTKILVVPSDTMPNSVEELSESIICLNCRTGL